MLIALLLALVPAAVLSLVLVSIEALADAGALARLLPAADLADPPNTEPERTTP